MNIYDKIDHITTFTESEKVFVEYLVTHPHEIKDYNVNELAKKSLVSISTIYRVISKLELKGLNDLKLQISTHLDSYLKELDAVDYNYPFHKYNTHHEIMSKMLSLYNQTLKSTFNLVDLETFLKVIQVLHKANHIALFPTIGNYFMAESFQQNMLEIGVKVDVVTERFYQHWTSQALKKGDVAIVISYAFRSPNITSILKKLHENEVKVIVISSTIKTNLTKYIDYHLFFSSYEDSEEKIASFSSRISLQYLLDCIYACYFNKDYEKNLEHKINNYID